jgi:hypothetical protein
VAKQVVFDIDRAQTAQQYIGPLEGDRPARGWVLDPQGSVSQAMADSGRDRGLAGE